MGSDAFEILWMAKAIAFGKGAVWLIHPLSFFGFYPFSFYPIGYPALIAIFLKVGLNTFAISFIISVILTVVSVIGNSKLSRYLFVNEKYQYLYTLVYTTVPIFVKFSYISFGPRAPILALSPWILYYLFEAESSDNNKNKIKSILKYLVVLIIMALCHRLWIVTPVLTILFVISLYIRKLINKRKFYRKQHIIFIMLTVSLIVVTIIGYFTFNIDYRKVYSPWFTNNTIYGLIFNISVEYGFRTGLIAIFFPIGLCYIAINKYNNKYKEFLILTLYLIFFSLLYSPYNSAVFQPFYVWISIFGVQKVNEWRFLKNLNYIISYMFYLIFIIVYSIYVLGTNLYLIIFFSLFFSIIIFEIINKTGHIKQKMANILRLTFFMVEISLFSVTIIDGQIKYTEKLLPYAYISNEELTMINVIKQSGYNESLIFISDVNIARHINGYSMLPTFVGNHHGQLLYYNFTSAKNISKSTIFSVKDILNGNLFIYNFTNPEYALFYKIMNINANSSQGINILIKSHIQFALIKKYNNNSIIPYIEIDRTQFYCTFINSLVNLQPLYETKHLALWKFY